MNLAGVPADVEKFVAAVSIHLADIRRQNLGQVSNAFIGIVNTEDGAEIARYDLTEDMAMETAMLFGEVYRHGGEWKFRALGAGYEKGFRAPEKVGRCLGLWTDMDGGGQQDSGDDRILRDAFGSMEPHCGRDSSVSGPKDARDSGDGPECGSMLPTAETEMFMD